MISTLRIFWNVIEHWFDCVAPVVDLGVRLYVAKIFFMSGLNKIQDWDSTLYLFQEEYHVPVLSPAIAAAIATVGELGFSALLAIGLFTRFSATALFILNIVAVASYYDALKDSPVALQDHLEWGLMLAVLLCSQVRQLTLDYWIGRHNRK